VPPSIRFGLTATSACACMRAAMTRIAGVGQHLLDRQTRAHADQHADADQVRNVHSGWQRLADSWHRPGPAGFDGRTNDQPEGFNASRFESGGAMRTAPQGVARRRPVRRENRRTAHLGTTPPQRMDLKQLEYFMHVAEFGSFTQSSRYLKVAQPALSRQVRTLEVELRQTLFVRNGRGVTLTQAGQRLLEHARGIVQQVQRARLDLEQQRGALSGRLVIGLPPSVSRVLTGPLVRAFRQRFPNAGFGVVEGLSDHLIERLAVGRVDFALVYSAAAPADIELQPLRVERLHLVGARTPAQGERLLGAVASLATVAGKELVIPARPHSIRLLLDAALADAGLKARVALEIESVPTMLDLVQHDGFHAVLTLNAIQRSGNRESFFARPIGRPPLGATLRVATAPLRAQGALMDAAIALVKELVSAHWA
jgi:LysR family nitrogen assimilation transcriptional regulator